MENDQVVLLFFSQCLGTNIVARRTLCLKKNYDSFQTTTEILHGLRFALLLPGALASKQSVVMRLKNKQVGVQEILIRIDGTKIVVKNGADNAANCKTIETPACSTRFQRACWEFPVEHEVAPEHADSCDNHQKACFWLVSEMARVEICVMLAVTHD